MIFRLFAEKGSVHDYLKGRKRPVELLGLDLADSRVEVIEEIEPFAPSSLSFLGDVSLPRPVLFVTMKVQGNPELLFYEPEAGGLLHHLDGFLEEGFLTVRWTGGGAEVLLGLLKDLSDSVNHEVEAYNRKGMIL